MTPEIGGPYMWARPGDVAARMERLTIEEAEAHSGIARLACLHREMVLARLDRESTLGRMIAVLEAGFRRPAPDPPRTAPWGVVPCGRPRVGMGVAVPNTERVTMRNVTPRLERRR